MLLLMAAPCALPAQSALVVVVRNDTMMIEKFTHTATRLDAELATKGGRQVLASTIGADGRLGTMSLQVFAPNARSDAPVLAAAQVTLRGDTAVVTTQQASGAPVPTQRISSRANAQPVLNTSFSQWEVLIAAARRARVSTATETAFFANGVTADIAFDNLLTDSVTASTGKVVSWYVTDSSGRVLRAGIPSQSLRVTRVDGIAVSKLGFAKPDYSPPADAPYTAESVTVPTTMGHTLGGTFTEPSAGGSVWPVVISITGSGAQDRDEYISVVPKGYRLFRQLADTLGRRGVAMLRLDDRGYGASGGNFATATSRDFADDIRAAVKYLRTRSDIDSKKIYLVGHSEGGMIAPMVAAAEPGVAGIVLMAGTGRTGRAIIEFQQRFAVEHDTTLTTAARATRLANVPANVDSLLRSNAWLTFFGGYDPLRTAKRVKAPVLILQGADDQQVIAAEATMLEKAFRAGGNRDVTTRIFPQLNHFFIFQPGGDPAGYSTLGTNLASSAVLGAVADWVVTRAAHSR